jgi:hypothetical protein
VLSVILIFFFQLSQFERGRIVGIREGGMLFRQIDRLHRNSTMLTRSRREGKQQHARGSRGKKQTTEQEERYL